MKKIILLAAIAIFAATPVFSLEVNPPKDSTFAPVENQEALDQYKLKCSEKVQTNWKNSKIKHDDTEIKISFKTLPDGSIEDIKILQSSKYEQNNQAALDAISDAAPFEPIPEELNAQYAEHIMSFPCRRYAIITPKMQ